MGSLGSVQDGKAFLGGVTAGCIVNLGFLALYCTERTGRKAGPPAVN